MQKKSAVRIKQAAKPCVKRFAGRSPQPAYQVASQQPIIRFPFLFAIKISTIGLRRPRFTANEIKKRSEERFFSLLSQRSMLYHVGISYPGRCCNCPVGCPFFFHQRNRTPLERYFQHLVDPRSEEHTSE